MTGPVFARSVGALLVGSGAQLFSNVASALLATLLLPVEQRGLMVVAATIAAFVGLLGGCGAGNAYRHSQPAARHPDRLAADYTVLASSLVLASAVVGAVVCLAMSWSADARLGEWTYLAATALSSSVQVLLVLVTDARFALGHFVAGARWAAYAAAAGLTGVCLALAADGDAASVVAAQAGAQLLVLALAVVSALRVRALIRAPASAPGVALLLGEGLRSLVLPLALVVVTRFDRLVLAVYDTTAAVAVYALASTIVEISRLAPTAVGQLTTREVAEGAGWSRLRLRMLQACLAAAIGGAALAALSFAAVPVVFGAAYGAAPGVAAVLLGSEIASAGVVVANLAIIGGGWSREGIRIGIAAIVVAVPAYAFGAMFGGMFGVAFARLVVFGILAAVMWFALKRTLSSAARATP